MNVKRCGLAVLVTIQLLLDQSLLGQPVVPGFTVEQYAPMCDPGDLSFDAGGYLFVGNGGRGGGTNGPAWIRRVAPGGSPVENYGVNQIADPDTVVVDEDGLVSGVPGSLLVGGESVWAIYPDQSIAVLFVDTCNVSDLAIDSTGRLLVLCLATTRVLVSDDGGLTELFLASPTTGRSMAVDAEDRIYTLAADGVIRIHSRDGTLLDDNFVSGLGDGGGLAFGSGPSFGTNLYVVTAGAIGELQRLDDEGNATVIGTGFDEQLVKNFTFGPDGAMYIRRGADHDILRIAPTCDADVNRDGSVGVEDLIQVIVGWGPCPDPPANCFGDVNDDDTVDVLDLVEVVLAWGPCPI